jgi:hypothetical protein
VSGRNVVHVAWTEDDLRGIGGAEEVRISSVRDDGSYRKYVRIWVVRVGDDLYVRSAYGPENGWFRRAKASGAGRVKIGRLERDVSFETPGPDVAGAVDAAYHAKYDKYGPKLVATVVGDESAAVTLRLLPRSG